jgi:hypothetical protein
MRQRRTGLTRVSVEARWSGRERKDARAVRRFGADCGADVSDASLCRLDDAIAVVYDRHAGVVFAWARSRVEQYAGLTAEDFARAWYSRRRCADQAGGAALPWLLGTA